MTKLEEIALAIHRARYPDAPVMDGIEGLGPTVAAQALDEARAALGPLQEPYNPILKAGATALLQRRFGCPPDDEIDAGRIFGRMIDAILNEKPGA